MQAHWPNPLGADFHAHYGLLPEDETRANARFEVVSAGRGLRRDFNIASNKRVPFVFQPTQPLGTNDKEVIRLLLNAESLELMDTAWTAPKGTPTAVTPLGNLFLPLVGLVDVNAERERLGKEIAKVEQELVKVRAKLSNETFVKGAPAAVVEEHRQREAEWQAKLAEIQRVADALSN
jgi:valyl-tRNA synthetase